MNLKYFAAKDLLYIIPASLALGAWFAFIQDGNRLIGFVSFSFLFLFSFTFLKMFSAWANGGRTLLWIIALAFFLRLAVGVALHLGLPVYGHADEDDRAGYVFTDAHRRDRPVEGDVGDAQRRGRADRRQDVGVVLHVG